MWIGERVTEKGVGNGISLLIFAGIVSNIAMSVANSVYAAFAGQLAAVGGGGSMIASLLVFILLYVPCVAALAAAKRELHSWKHFILTICIQMGTAYIVSLLVYQLGSLFIH